MTKQDEDVRVRRGHENASYDRREISQIIDAGYCAHIAFCHDTRPVCVPMMYWRQGDFIFWHGSTKSRAMLASAGDEVCITITHWDGLVFARSAFHHSANYRSVMIFGKAQAVPDDEKTAHLHALMERIAPGRDADLRPMSKQELKATALLRIPIDRVSAKMRFGPPRDDPADTDWPVWSGIVPVTQTLERAVSAAETEADNITPANIEALEGIKI
ncbi:pyridoxamine 5'-phosphate oxidase family protein [Erythrobacter sp. HA6-11]